MIKLCKTRHSVLDLVRERIKHQGSLAQMFAGKPLLDVRLSAEQPVDLSWLKDATSPTDPAERIPEPRPRPLPLPVRRDLRSLSQAELDDYRMRVADAAADASGQVFFSIHGDWCLHYQEAFLLWHRAFLTAFEQRIGCPVPYWNWYAKDASVDGVSSAGLPQAFRDETYVHPRTGETRPNPLRFAAAKRGISKACASSA